MKMAPDIKLESSDGLKFEVYFDDREHVLEYLEQGCDYTLHPSRGKPLLRIHLLLPEHKVLELG